jgi:hypothetical protein
VLQQLLSQHVQRHLLQQQLQQAAAAGLRPARAASAHSQPLAPVLPLFLLLRPAPPLMCLLVLWLHDHPVAAAVELACSTLIRHAQPHWPLRLPLLHVQQG